VTTVNSDFISKINVILNETALDKDISWESLDFEKVKKHAIIRSAETFMCIEDLTASQETKVLSTISLIAYLTLENTYLRIERQRSREMKGA